MSILDVLRAIFGALFALFVPGFAWSYIFFSGKNIDWIERVVISFGLSFALVPLTIFCLNWLFHMKINLLSTIGVACGLTAIPVVMVFIKRTSLGKSATSKIKSAFDNFRIK